MTRSGEAEPMRTTNANQLGDREDLRRLLLEVLKGLADDVVSLTEIPPDHGEDLEENRRLAQKVSPSVQILFSSARLFIGLLDRRALESFNSLPDLAVREER